MECIDGELRVRGNLGEDWADEDEDEEGRILDQILVWSYATIAGLALAVVVIAHLAGA